MRPFLLVVTLIVLGPAPARAQADRLELVAQELEGIVNDLEAAQALTTDLRGRLTALEALSAEHQAAVAEQERLLAEYRTTVDALEAHDRASLNLAQDLKTQLEAERRLTAWVLPVAGIAVAVAVVEAVVLGWPR